MVRIPRNDYELLTTLQDQIKLLRKYHVEAFQKGDFAYLGEIAGKLRMLVYEGGRNKPLLLSLMDKFQIEIPFVLHGPHGPIFPGQISTGQPKEGDIISLRQFLELTAYWRDSPTKGAINLSKKELIAKWAQQDGAAHQDHELDEVYDTSRSSGIYIGGLPGNAAEFKVTTETILLVAEKFLKELKNKNSYD